ncbi:MAG: hypothetical protein GF329_22535 [Candidatus Lokiarchaeota archaeon]|nr:hypothetical protein [Candidatus Lokiarchaeota archaeon]
MSSRDDQVVAEIVKLIDEAYNPREVRAEINKKYPEYDDKEKLERLIPKILNEFDAKKRKYLKKTQYLMYVSIAGEDITKG